MSLYRWLCSEEVEACMEMKRLLPFKIHPVTMALMVRER